MDKNNLLRSVGLPISAMALALLMGCGQKGPLTLPKPQATPAAGAAGAASAAR